MDTEAIEPRFPYLDALPRPEDPHWIFPEGTVIGIAVAKGEISLTFEQASQRVAGSIIENEVHPKLWQIANSLEKDDLVYVRGRFPYLDADDARNVITALGKRL